MVSDAARRCSDVIQGHLALGIFGRWVSIRLSDGGSDGCTYGTRREAISHQLHERQCAYIKIPPTGMPPVHAERFLAINRSLYDKGMRLSDPDGPELISPINLEQMQDAYRRLRANR